MNWEAGPGEGRVAEVDGLVGLAAALEGLREELEVARLSGEGRQVRFEVSEVTLTVETVASRETDGSGKIRWWVIEAGGGAKAGREQTQTLTLTLVPKLRELSGDSGPLEVGGEQARPGG
jgi:hypothetical protein